jgi:hypothetical protein
LKVPSLVLNVAMGLADAAAVVEKREARAAVRANVLRDERRAPVATHLV